MINCGFIKVPKGFSQKLASLYAKCPICDIEGANKLPRGPPVDRTELPVGARFHANFHFYNIETIRRFTALFVITEAMTSRVWIFPCMNKRPSPT
jgi:hypothetical protein